MKKEIVAQCPKKKGVAVIGEDDMQKQAVDVAAALIWREGRFMICRRPANKARALLWEFVGGKVEAGETKEQALIRECREELDITVAVGEIYAEVTHEYPDLIVRLTLFCCTIAAGEPKLLEHSGLKWIAPAEIPDYDFCPADESILKKIMRESAARKA